MNGHKKLYNMPWPPWAKQNHFVSNHNWIGQTLKSTAYLHRRKMSFDSMPKYRRASYSSTKIIKILKWVHLKGLENGDTKKLLMVLEPSFNTIFLENGNRGKKNELN